MIVQLATKKQFSPLIRLLQSTDANVTFGTDTSVGRTAVDFHSQFIHPFDSKVCSFDERNLKKKTQKFAHSALSALPLRWHRTK